MKWRSRRHAEPEVQVPEVQVPLEGIGECYVDTVVEIRGRDEWHYQIVVLRDDQLEEIRKIVREEIERARPRGWSA